MLRHDGCVTHSESGMPTMPDPSAPHSDEGHEPLAGPPRHGTSRGVLVAVFTVLGLAIVGLIIAIGLLLGRLAVAPQELSTSEPPAGTEESLAPDEYNPPDDSGAPEWWPQFEEHDGPDGPPGPVAGPTYGEEEPVREQNHPLTFDLPRTYGCVRDGETNPPAGSVVCIDESQAFDADGTPPGGRIRVDPCESPCDADAWEEVRIEQAGSELQWESVDDATRYLERPGTSDTGEETVLVAMSRMVEAPDHAGVDLVLFVSLTGRADDLPTFQKIVNELHERTQAP